jgi:hypothetical protein
MVRAIGIDTDIFEERQHPVPPRNIAKLTAYGHDRIQARPGILEYLGNSGTRAPPFPDRLNDGSVPPDFTARDSGGPIQQSGYRVGQNGLSGAAFADEADNLAGSNTQVDPIQRLDRTAARGKFDRQVHDFEH